MLRFVRASTGRVATVPDFEVLWAIVVANPVLVMHGLVRF
jgi:hypothetical protein